MSLRSDVYVVSDAEVQIHFTFPKLALKVCFRAIMADFTALQKNIRCEWRGVNREHKLVQFSVPAFAPLLTSSGEHELPAYEILECWRARTRKLKDLKREHV